MKPLYGPVMCCTVCRHLKSTTLHNVTVPTFVSIWMIAFQYESCFSSGDREAVYVVRLRCHSLLPPRWLCQQVVFTVRSRTRAMTANVSGTSCANRPWLVEKADEAKCGNISLTVSQGYGSLSLSHHRNKDLISIVCYYSSTELHRAKQE